MTQNKNNKVSSGGNTRSVKKIVNSSGSNAPKAQKPTPKNKNSKKKKRFRGLKIFLLIMVLLTVFAGIGVGGFVVATAQKSPELDVNSLLKLNEPSQLVSNNNTYIDSVGTSGRDVLDSKDIPKTLKDAVIAIEDQRFYSHSGIDFKRLVGAAFYSIKSKLGGGNDFQGGSSITQQLIKYRLFLNSSIQDRLNIERKIQEMYLALQLEKKVSKDEILTSYMNTILYGENAYGVGAAAKLYFNVDAIKLSDLSLIQSAFIAGIGQSPNHYNPFNEENQDPNNASYIVRTKTVLSKMKELNSISQKQYDDALNEINTKGRDAFNFNRGGISTYTGVYEDVTAPSIDQVRKELISQKGYTKEEADNLINNGGLTIKLTVDLEMQKKVEEIMNNPANYGGNLVFSDGINKELQAAGLFIDNTTNEVKVVVGGVGANRPLRSYNRATSSETMPFRKAPGSIIKPLSVYGPSLDSKTLTMASTVDDSDLTQEELNASGYKAQPKNVAGGHKGIIPLTQSVAESTNVTAIKELVHVGLDTSKKYLRNFGITLNETNDVFGASLALGELTDGTTPLEMAAAYSVFANNGIYKEPKFFTEVLDKDGNVILTAQNEEHQVLSPEAAYLTYSLLKEPITGKGGTASAANLGTIPTAGKTGSSGEFMNLWFSGLTKYYSGAVWIGYDDPRSSNAKSSNAARVWKKIMQSILTEEQLNSGDEIPRPSTLVAREICLSDGLLATAASKAANDVRTMYFIPGTAPTKYSTFHNKVEEPKKEEEKPEDKKPNDNSNTETPSSDNNGSGNENNNGNEGNNESGNENQSNGNEGTNEGETPNNDNSNNGNSNNGN